MKSSQSPRHSKKICIILPTYNENGNLQRVIPLIQGILQSNGLADSAVILVVDDNSPDGTGKQADELAQVYGNIQVLHRPAKLGIGSAYKQAFDYALKRINPDVVFQMDADLSHDPKLIPDFLLKLEEGYDIVVGSRRVPGGGPASWNFRRQVLSLFANKLAKSLCGVKTQDATSGYRALTRTALQKSDYSSIESEGYAFQIETLYRFQEEGLKIAEIPIVFVGRKTGRTKLDKMQMLTFLFLCLKLFFRRSGNLAYWA